MSRLIKIIDKDNIEIADYRCSAVLYPEIPPTLQNIKDQIEHCEDWCVFKRTINPFQMYAENEELKERIDKAIEYIEEKYDYILKDATFLDHDELVDRKHMLKLIGILKGDE